MPSFVLIVFMFLPASLLVADTLWLRDGTIRENVEVEFRRDDVIIRHRSGKREMVRKSDVMRLQVAEVKVPPGEADEISALERQLEEMRRAGRQDDLLRDELRRAQEAGGRPREAREQAEKERVRENTSRGLIWQPRPDEDQLSVGGSFALGLIPGYSGSFRSGHTFGGGLLSVLEAVALLNAIDTGSAYKDYSDAQRSRVIVYAATRLYLTQLGYDYRGGITHRTIAGDAGGRTNSDKARYDNASYGFLLLLLFADGIYSAVTTSDWNDGSWEGPRSAVPTTPVERGILSTLYPGVGQIQAGEPVKGGLWAAAGTALLAAELSSEARLRRAQNDYTESSRGSFIKALVATVANVAVVDMYRWIAYASWQRRTELRRASRERKELLNGLIAFWTLNIFDAVFWSGKNEVVSSAPRVTPEIAYRPSSERGKPESFFGLRFTEAW